MISWEIPMSRFEISEHERQGPNVQLIPLIDVLFFVLILFMCIFIYNQQEAETKINVPQSRSAKETSRAPGQIILTITKDGRFIVGKQELTPAQLKIMLEKVVALYPDQSVVIRADEDTYHKYVIEALDTCSRVGIWDISFSAATSQ